MMGDVDMQRGRGDDERESVSMRDNFSSTIVDEQCLCRTVVLWPVAPTDATIM